MKYMYSRGAVVADLSRLRIVTNVAIACVAMLAASARAAEIQTGNPDVEVRFDTTLRYNLGVRASGRDPLIANNVNFDESDFKFDRGDLITNRLDVFGEFDVSYQRSLGLRVSGALWYDAAYGSEVKSNPQYAGFGLENYPGGRYTPYVKRYYAGPSGEFLDAFVYANYDLAGVPVSVKLGRFAQLWGESLIGNTNAVSYGQTPNDSLKSLAAPGASAKETAVPIGQLSLTVQPSDKVQLQAQYVYEWRGNRLPEGGTYFGGADMILQGPTAFLGRQRLPEIKGEKGDLGVAARVRPDWFDGTLGLYYRKFGEKQPWAVQFVPAALPAGFATRASYAKDVELIGVSMSTNVSGWAVSAEVSQRRNEALNSATQPAPGLFAVGERAEGAIGDTWHGLVNAIRTFPRNDVFDTAFLAMELSYQRLDKVTKNGHLYKASGYTPAGCFGDASTNIIDGCSTKSAWTLGVAFTPVFSQVWSGIDLEVPLVAVLNLRGNGPVTGGGSEGFNVYKIGVTAKAYGRHQLDLTYNWYGSKMRSVNPANPVQYSSINGAPYGDKAWFGLTYQTSF